MTDDVREGAPAGDQGPEVAEMIQDDPFQLANDIERLGLAHGFDAEGYPVSFEREYHRDEWLLILKSLRFLADRGCD